MIRSSIAATSVAVCGFPLTEDVMPQAHMVECTPDSAYSKVVLTRTGEADVEFNGRLLLTVETERVRKSKPTGRIQGPVASPVLGPVINQPWSARSAAEQISPPPGAVWSARSTAEQIAPPPGMVERWRVYRLYEVENKDALVDRSKATLVLADEGHSTADGEVTKFAVYKCPDERTAWEKMGSIDELKKAFSQIGRPVVVGLDTL